ncbi:MAG TPA: class I SAM-dependent methyltransferase [Miltoncostaeaceae bacterium]|nr:class I SAM-dependent methyltransferase [Miltoncostaeaceae bacterium]
MAGDGLTEHARQNRAAWDARAAEYAEAAERSWAEAEPSWGIWSIPEREVGALPPLHGLSAVELGCGTAYWSAWLARAGARPVGVDLSAAQLATARRMQERHGLRFPLVHASAESVPLAGAAFDLALSEYGASLWCDPDLWLAEAARLLRPGGTLVFLTVSPIFMTCVPDQADAATADRLLRPYFEMRRFEWPGEDGVEFCLTYGDWIGTLGRHGFALEALHELRPPAGADAGRFTFVTADWARRWPHEVIWVARRRDA